MSCLILGALLLLSFDTIIAGSIKAAQQRYRIIM
jgi:hypothetical protein